MLRKSSGFTLIELLVVIAIIAILATILLPSLNHARTLAKNSACVSNLKGIGIALNLYGKDHDERLPQGPFAYPTSTGGNYYPLDGKWVYDLVNVGNYIPQSSDYKIPNTGTQLPIPKMFFCPMDDFFLNFCIQKQANTRTGYAGYCYFGWFKTIGADGWKGPETTLDSDSPVSTELMSDLMQASGGIHDYISRSSHLQTTNPGNNTLFLDNHIEFKELDDLEDRGFRHGYSNNYFYW